MLSHPGLYPFQLITTHGIIKLPMHDKAPIIELVKDLFFGIGLRVPDPLTPPQQKIFFRYDHRFHGLAVFFASGTNITQKVRYTHRKCLKYISGFKTITFYDDAGKRSRETR